jgi:hypothetical protein
MTSERPGKHDDHRRSELWTLAVFLSLGLLGFLLYEAWYYTKHSELVPLHLIITPLEVPKPR